MKVIALNGSPRSERSSTMKLTRAFLEGTQWTDTEIIDISKLNVRGCTGCYSCWTKTPGKCVINDDMTDILPKLIEADIIIWSFPLYSCSFPGQMKCFMDRRLPIALPFMDESSATGEHPLRHDLSKQRHFFISTCGFWTAEGNYDSVIKMLEHGGKGANHEDFTIFCGQGGLFEAADMADDMGLNALVEGYLNTMRQAGSEYANGGMKKETRDLLSQPLIPKEAYESAANASWGV
ncbi:MAG: flavodoxin family protein [Defluviitaleaceae bacterium]|nr:flavodoxin family protein [Defluviitaleaceae bacterium]